MKNDPPKNTYHTEVYNLAEEVFGSSVKADVWLNEVHALLGKSPNDYAKTESGQIEVKKY